MSSFINSIVRSLSSSAANSQPSTPPAADAPQPSSSSIANDPSTTVIEKPTENAFYSADPSSARPTFTKAPTATSLFPGTDPAIDGEDCLHDCETCTIKYPAKFSIDEEDQLYGHVGGWDTHLVVATGKTDWVRDVADEVGSVMEAVGKLKVEEKPSNGVREQAGFISRMRKKVEQKRSKHKYMFMSASNMPVPEPKEGQDHDATSVLLLPAWKIIDGVTPRNVSELVTKYVNTSPTNTTPLQTTSASSLLSTAASAVTTTANTLVSPLTSLAVSSPESVPVSHLTSRPCPHNYLILLCSQKTRDARCGQSAPLLRREFERQLRPLGLFRDLHDERPGGCGIYFISHVGGHKYSANCLIMRREGSAGTHSSLNGNGSAKVSEPGQTEDTRQAAQCIWLARVRPEDCENIVRYTILQGKVVKPDRQLRGGYDRSKGLVSW